MVRGSSNSQVICIGNCFNFFFTNCNLVAHVNDQNQDQEKYLIPKIKFKSYDEVDLNNNMYYL